MGYKTLLCPSVSFDTCSPKEIKLINIRDGKSYVALKRKIYTSLRSSPTCWRTTQDYMIIEQPCLTVHDDESHDCSNAVPRNIMLATLTSINVQLEQTVIMRNVGVKYIINSCERTMLSLNIMLQVLDIVITSSAEFVEKEIKRLGSAK